MSAVDIRYFRGRNKKEAIAKATIEHGSNFIYLSDREVKVGGFLGLGQKTECEIKIMLNKSKLDRKPLKDESLAEPIRPYKSEDSDIDDNYENKLISDRIEIKKHTTETIDASEMADRIVAVTKALKQAQKEKHNEALKQQQELDNRIDSRKTEILAEAREEIMSDTLLNDTHDIKEEKDFIPISNNNLHLNNDIHYNNSYRDYDDYSNFNKNDDNPYLNIKSSLMEHQRSVRNYNNNQASLDDSVKRIVQDQLKDIVKEYLENNIPNLNKNNDLEQYHTNYSSFDNHYTNSRQSNIYRDSYRDNSRRYYSGFDNNNQYEDDGYRSSLNEIKELRENRLRNNNSERTSKLSNNRRNYFDRHYESKSHNTQNDSVEYNDAMEDVFQFLRSREFPEEVLIELRDYLLKSSNARFVQSREIIKEEIDKYFANRLIFADGIEIGNKKKIIVFVGPTGVGKTTTIPKIASQYMKSGKKVSFVTIDNYRIGAVDQLQKYANIMKVPFSSASTPEALRAEIRKMDSSSLLFIDTMGRSPKATDEILSVARYFTTVGRFDLDIQLVMSATAKYKDAVKIMNSFKPTNYKGVILTKLDETDYLASSICAISKFKLPITYVTHGQGVPKDISTARKYGVNIVQGLYGNLK